jgi:hypothetical protein
LSPVRDNLIRYLLSLGHMGVSYHHYGCPLLAERLCQCTTKHATSPDNYCHFLCEIECSIQVH